jgi:hypothetical protein
MPSLRAITKELATQMADVCAILDLLVPLATIAHQDSMDPSAILHVMPLPRALDMECAMQLQDNVRAMLVG